MYYKTVLRERLAPYAVRRCLAPLGWGCWNSLTPCAPPPLPPDLETCSIPLAQISYRSDGAAARAGKLTDMPAANHRYGIGAGRGALHMVIEFRMMRHVPPHEEDDIRELFCIEAGVAAPFGARTIPCAPRATGGPKHRGVQGQHHWHQSGRESVLRLRQL